MVQSIRAAEERFRAENQRYLSISDVTGTGLGHYYPVSTPGRDKHRFFRGRGDAEEALWHLLNPTVTGPVQFGYSVVAGSPDARMPAPNSPTKPVWPDPPTEPWYVIEARGDTDGDGKGTFVVASSLTEAFVEDATY